MAYSVYQKLDSLDHDQPIDVEQKTSASISIGPEAIHATATGPGSTEKVMSMMGTTATSSITVMDMAEASQLAAINLKNSQAQKTLVESKRDDRRSVLEIWWFVVFCILSVVVFCGSFYLFLHDKTAGGIAFVSAGGTLLTGMGGAGVLAVVRRKQTED